MVRLGTTTTVCKARGSEITFRARGSSFSCNAAKSASSSAEPGSGQPGSVTPATRTSTISAPYTVVTGPRRTPGIFTHARPFPNLSRSMPAPMLTAGRLAVQDGGATGLLVPGSPVRIVLRVVGQLVGDHVSFFVDVLFDGAPEGGVTDLVRAVGDDWKKAPGQLVLS